MAILLSWIVCVAAWFLIVLVDVESVMGTGPIILVLGVITAFASIFSRYRWALVLGILHILITFLFYELVICCGWSPRDAYYPFTIMGLAYLGIVTPLTFMTWRHRPAVFDPWQCQGCGYLLYGLTENRCPECGLEFDVEKTGHLPPMNTQADDS